MEREKKRNCCVGIAVQGKIIGSEQFLPIPPPPPPSVICASHYLPFSVFLSWLWNAEDKSERKIDKERSVVKTTEMYEMHRWM